MPALGDVYFLTDIGGNVFDSFLSENLMFHMLGVMSTYVLVDQNVDYKIHRFFNARPEVSNWFFPVVITGALGPLLTGGGFYWHGKGTNTDETRLAGHAVLQANLINIVYVSILKGVTGRPHPNYESGKDIASLSREFNFGFLENGIFYGWPSGHTSATMVTLTTLMYYYPDNIWLKIGSILFMGYTIVGVSAAINGQMHWFSDTIAATFMAYSIGSTVGSSFRSIFDGTKPTESAFQITPLYGEDLRGVAFSLHF